MDWPIRVLSSQGRDSAYERNDDRKAAGISTGHARVPGNVGAPPQTPVPAEAPCGGRMFNPAIWATFMPPLRLQAVIREYVVAILWQCVGLPGVWGGVPAHPVAVTEIPVAASGNPVALPVHTAALLMFSCALGCKFDRLTIVQAWLRQIFASELNKLKPAKIYFNCPGLHFSFGCHIFAVFLN